MTQRSKVKREAEKEQKDNLISLSKNYELVGKAQIVTMEHMEDYKHKRTQDNRHCLNEDDSKEALAELALKAIPRKQGVSVVPNLTWPILKIHLHSWISMDSHIHLIIAAVTMPKRGA